MKFREAINQARGKNGNILWNGEKGYKAVFDFLLVNELTDRSEYWKQFTHYTEVDFRDHNPDATFGIDDLLWEKYGNNQQRRR